MNSQKNKLGKFDNDSLTLLRETFLQNLYYHFRFKFLQEGERGRYVSLYVLQLFSTCKRKLGNL